MICKDNFSLEHIKALEKETGSQLAIIERTMFAFGLLEAISQTGLQFIFKGGSCLMLLLNEPKRFSTDIDIIVPPGTDINDYINKAGHIFPFFHQEEQLRHKQNNILIDDVQKYNTERIQNKEFSSLSPLRKINLKLTHICVNV